MTRPTLALFLDPSSVAVIGASRDPGKVGGSVLANLRAARFAGRILPINAHADMVQGIPSAPSILAVEGPVDLAVITVPAPAVLPALKECVAKGVAGAVVISAGFREAGEEGRTREAELRAWLRDQPIRVLGPNCLGWIRPSRGLNLTFAPGMPEPGGIAFVSHSGALAVAILDWARERRMGFSLFASLGNQADITEADVLDAVAADAETRVIAGYIEGVADGRRFFEALRAAAAVKPVVLLKTGRSAEGARAVSSHTGALAGSDRAFDAAVKQAGALRVGTVEELFDVARGLASQPLPRGRRLLVVTNGGGLGIVATDAARDAGLEVAPLEAPVRDRLAAVLPPTASLANPVDLVGDADATRYSHALHAIGGGCRGCRARDAHGPGGDRSSRGGAGRDRRDPGLDAFRSPPPLSAARASRRACARSRRRESRVIPSRSRRSRTLAGMARLSARRGRRAEPARPVERNPAAAAAAAGLRASGPPTLGMSELEPVLTSYGIAVLPSQAVETAEEAASAAERLGFPVALKLRSPDISHKTDVGGVHLGLQAPSEVAAATTAMLARVRAARPEARIDGVLVQPMAPHGKELLLGMIRDPQFGPMVVVGFGGIYVEILKDTAARLCPLDRCEALDMLG